MEFLLIPDLRPTINEKWLRTVIHQSCSTHTPRSGACRHFDVLSFNDLRLNEIYSYYSRVKPHFLHPRLSLLQLPVLGTSDATFFHYIYTPRARLDSYPSILYIGLLLSSGQFLSTHTFHMRKSNQTFSNQSNTRLFYLTNSTSYIFLFTPRLLHRPYRFNPRFLAHYATVGITTF